MSKICKPIILVLIILFFTSCQAVPEAEYAGKGAGVETPQVMPKPEATARGAEAKGEKNMEMEAPPPKKYTAPAKWEEEFPLEFFTFSFDTPVRVPDIESFPVLSLRQRVLSTEYIRDFIAPFLTGVERYAEMVETKSDIERRIVETKREYRDARKNGRVMERDESEALAQLEKLLQEASAQLDIRDIGEFYTQEFPSSLIFYCADELVIQIWAGNTSIYLTKIQEAILQPESWVWHGYAVRGERPGTLLKNVKLSEEEALAQAQLLLRQAGIEYLSLITAEKARFVEDKTPKTVSEGWLLIFGRSDVGYIPVDIGSFGGPTYRTLQASYTAPIDMEYMLLYIDENGLQWLSWENPVEITGILHENTTLLDFRDIQTQIRQQLRKEWAWIEEKNEFYDLSQTVFELTLSYSLLPMEENLDAAMLVPAWYVFYKSNAYLEHDAVVPSLLVINAIDGKVIDPIMPMEKREGVIFVE